MSPHDFLKHGINYEQLRIDAGLLVGLMADDNLSPRVHNACERLIKVITDLQETVVDADLLNADLLNTDNVYGPNP